MRLFKGPRTALALQGVGCLTLAALGLGAAGRVMTAPARATPSHGTDRSLASKIQDAFPNTKIGSIKCGTVPGLCEVTAGKNVFYVSPDGRYAIVGSVLDLQERVDLTDRRVKELAEVDAITRKITGEPAPVAVAEAAPAPAAQHGGATPSPSLGVIKVDLPASNAIVHHAGAPVKISVISDLNCGYCKMLFEELKTAPDIQVTEYPVQLLRPDSLDKAKMALCAKDREATANSIYFGGQVQVGADCGKALEAVEANTAFARAHGISGTPTIIRGDGQANAGYMPLDQLRSWAKAGAAA